MQLICDLIFKAALEHNWGEKIPERIHIPRALIDRILAQDRLRKELKTHE